MSDHLSMSAVPEFIDQAGKISIQLNKIMCVYGPVGKISPALMQLLKFYANLIAQYHTLMTLT